MSNVTSQKTLTHKQFYRVVEVVKTHRESIAKLGTWRECRDFLLGKLKDDGGELLPVSEHSAQHACEVAEVKLSGKRKRPGRRDYEDFRLELEIMARAIGRLYDKLGEEMPPGLQRLVALSRREATLKELQGGK